MLKTFLCNKLVRHKDPERMKNAGYENVKTRSFFHDDEKIEYLKKKLQEEVFEAVHAITREKSLSEFCDVYESLSTLLTLWGTSIEDLQKQSEKKRNGRGSYLDGVLLESISLDTNHPEFNRYKKQPEKYPIHNIQIDHPSNTTREHLN